MQGQDVGTLAAGAFGEHEEGVSGREHSFGRLEGVTISGPSRDWERAESDEGATEHRHVEERLFGHKEDFSSTEKEAEGEVEIGAVRGCDDQRATLRNGLGAADPGTKHQGTHGA